MSVVLGGWLALPVALAGAQGNPAAGLTPHPRALPDPPPADEMLGTPKPKESLAGLWRARSVLEHDHGNLIINIGKPISMHEFSKGRVNRQLQTRSPPPHPVTTEERELVEDLGYQIVAELEQGLVVMCPALAAALLLAHWQRGRTSVSVPQIVDEIRWLAALVHQRGFTVDVPVSDADVLSTLRALQPAVVLHERQVELLFDDPFNAICVAHFRNEVVHVFLLEALKEIAIATASATTESESAEVSRAPFKLRLFKAVRRQPNPTLCSLPHCAHARSTG